jgi:hypothetical protein
LVIEIAVLPINAAMMTLVDAFADISFLELLLFGLATTVNIIAANCLRESRALHR